MERAVRGSVMASIITIVKRHLDKSMERKGLEECAPNSGK